MKKNKIIPLKYMRNYLPIDRTVLWTFLMYYFKASQLIWGIYITITVIVWIIFVIDIWNQEDDETLINK